MANFSVHSCLLISVRSSIFPFSIITPMLRTHLYLQITSEINRRRLGTLIKYSSLYRITFNRKAHMY